MQVRRAVFGGPIVGIIAAGVLLWRGVRGWVVEAIVDTPLNGINRNLTGNFVNAMQKRVQEKDIFRVKIFWECYGFKYTFLKKDDDGLWTITFVSEETHATNRR